MCFCVFAVGLELLRMQETHVRRCFTNRVSEFVLVAEPAKVIDKPDYVLCTKQGVWRTGKILHQMELSGSEHHYRTVQQVRDDVCWILVF